MPDTTSGLKYAWDDSRVSGRKSISDEKMASWLSAPAGNGEFVHAIDFLWHAVLPHSF
jgi:hypothetical protein